MKNVLWEILAWACFVIPVGLLVTGLVLCFVIMGGLK
jgi:hypothetical protein